MTTKNLKTEAGDMEMDADKSYAWMDEADEDEAEYEHGVAMGDPRRCPYHPHVQTSSPDGMFDGLCGECEYAADDERNETDDHVDFVAWLTGGES